VFFVVVMGWGCIVVYVQESSKESVEKKTDVSPKVICLFVFVKSKIIFA